MGEKDCDAFDICITEQERENGILALAEFNKNNYAGCLQYLSKLENRSQDPKVLHNRAVAEFYKNDLKKIENFKKSLAAVFTQAKMKEDVIEHVEQCVIHYNQAVLLYHQKKYTDALRIVDKIYKFIEPMDENLARKVCFMLIELYICTQQHSKALTLINCIENQFTSNTETKGKGDKEKPGEKEKKEQKVQVSQATLEAFRKKLVQYRARCYLMSHSLKLAKREIKTISSTEGSTTATLCLKAHLEYLRGNHKGAMKIFNSSPTDIISFKETGESATVIFYNNMGVIHYAMGKFNLACHYFRQAIKEDRNTISSFGKGENGDSSRPLYTIGGSRYHELMYNLGIALLHAGHPSQAFDCLITAVQRYHRNSRLWLRIAECCIQVHKPTNEIDFNIAQRQKDIVNQIIGVGRHRKIILTSRLSTDMKYSTESQSYAIPVATIEFASLCLRNALLLLPTETTATPVPILLLQGGVPPPPPPPGPTLAPSPPVCSAELRNLKNSVLAASAYVSLCLGDYVVALEHAQNLLAQSVISGAHKLLGHLYASEALILMDKLTEAMEHLNPEHVTDIDINLPKEDSKDDEENILNTKPRIKWFPENLTTAHAILQYNLAVALTIRGELEKAAELLKRVWQFKSNTCRVPIHVVMLFLYIELQLGHTEIARNFIKEYCS